ncbi:hypothetical protein J6590_095983 [Homalodisca vitripennis]|nr:hypothetical protein J6590_095983 [Homalodisca vitripennis]
MSGTVSKATQQTGVMLMTYDVITPLYLGTSINLNSYRLHNVFYAKVFHTFHHPRGLQRDQFKGDISRSVTLIPLTEDTYIGLPWAASRSGRLVLLAGCGQYQ